MQVFRLNGQAELLQGLFVALASQPAVGSVGFVNQGDPPVAGLNQGSNRVVSGLDVVDGHSGRFRPLQAADAECDGILLRKLGDFFRALF